MAITNEKLMQTKQHAYIGKIYGGNISSQINQQAYNIHTCVSISPAKPYKTLGFFFIKIPLPPFLLAPPVTSFPLVCGSRFLSSRASHYLPLLFITSAAWLFFIVHHISSMASLCCSSDQQHGFPVSCSWSHTWRGVPRVLPAPLIYIKKN